MASGNCIGRHLLFQASIRESIGTKKKGTSFKNLYQDMRIIVDNRVYLFEKLIGKENVLFPYDWTIRVQLTKRIEAHELLLECSSEIFSAQFPSRDFRFPVIPILVIPCRLSQVFFSVVKRNSTIRNKK
jgi:hypothetical protein